METSNVGAWLEQAHNRLAGSSEQPGLETQLLLAYVLDKPRPWVIAHPEALLLPCQQERAEQSLQRLLAGEPLPYLLGRQEFYGLEFAVNPDVLIPRPETELVVEEALAWLRRNPSRRHAVDVGTGSGCIAISLLHHIPDLHMLAVDRSLPALRLARRNSDRLVPDRPMCFACSNLLSAFRGPFDLVCANLPYIPTLALDKLPVARYEPRLALDGGPEGLDLIRALLVDAPRWMAPGGLLLLEIESSQGESAAKIARDCFPAVQQVILSDLAGLPRLLRLQL